VKGAEPTADRARLRNEDVWQGGTRTRLVTGESAYLEASSR
jgi:hypothetical protein